MSTLDVLQRWGFALLGAGFLLVAFLVNRFAPANRRRLRRGLLLYLVFLALTGAEHALQHLPIPSVAAWGEHLHLVAGLAAAFTCVELCALLVFRLLLPAVGVQLVAITSDVFVGFAYLFAGFGVLHAAGVTMTSVITTSAIVTAVLALSLQATLGNIIGGFALQLDGSVRVGDWVQLADGTQGKIVAIRWRHTVVETRNWDTVIVPNANLLAQNIVILGKRTDKPLQHRMWVYFDVDYRWSPSQVIDVVRDALWAAPMEGVAEDPKPSVICYDFAKDGRDSFGYYAVRYWLTDLAADDPTSSRVRTRIYSALKRAGMQLARPMQTVFFTAEEDERTRAARHKERQLHALERVELFQSLTGEEREFVSSRLKYAPFTAGETVTHQGAVAHWLYILCGGKVDVRRRAEGSELVKSVSTIAAPGFFGEFGLMTGRPRLADVVAMTDVECYRLDKEGLERILQERPEVAEQISRTLARRELELQGVAEGLDEEAQRRRMQHEQTRILDQIQEFFGLARTSRL
jgi:small-conductance mechanosensitive channel/CRP-like cAMP-binding protein